MKSPTTGLAAAAALLALAAACAEPAPPGRADRVQEVVGDFLGKPEARRVLEENAALPVEARTVAPLGQAKPEAPVLPGLLAAPPSAVELEVPPGMPPGTLLSLATGFDAGAYELPGGGTVRFQIELDGRRIGDAAQAFGAGVRKADRRWTRARIPLDGATRVTLRTELEGESGAPVEAAWGLLELIAPVEVRRRPASPEAPNLVLVLIDTLRADRLGCYGYEKPTSPVLDALAARGTRFERAFADSPWTWPSTASLLTSLPAPAHGLTSFESCFLAQSLVTLPEVLRRAGLHTAAFSSNPLVSTTHNFQQGFEHFSEYPMVPSAELLPDVERWLREHAGERFFLYLHITDPHGPYRPDPELAKELVEEPPPTWKRGRLRELFERRAAGEAIDMAEVEANVAYISSLYDGEVRMADLSVGRVLEWLDELGLSDRTVVAVTSDHGEEFLEHGYTGHGKHLHDELVRVPLILAGPGVPEGEVVETLVQNRYVPQTLLALGDLDARELPDGPDLLAPDVARAGSEPIFLSTDTGRWMDEEGVDRGVVGSVYGLRQPTWSYQWAPREDGPEDDLERHHDLAADPLQRDDQGGQHPERSERMQQAILDWLGACAQQNPGSLRAGGGTLQMLKALGYIDGD